MTNWIGLPAYNEEMAIDPVFSKLMLLANSGDAPIKVVLNDDGSTDQTRARASQWLDRVDLEIIGPERNQGLGSGMNNIVRHFIDHAGPADHLVVMDCDASHDPGQVMELLRASESGADVVIASRYRRGASVTGVAMHRILLSIGAAALYKLLHPIRGVRDYTCGYRLYSYQCLSSLVGKYGAEPIRERGFACMVELLLKIQSSGRFVFGEVPLKLRYDLKLSESKMDVAGNSINLLKKLWYWRFGGLL